MGVFQTLDEVGLKMKWLLAFLLLCTSASAQIYSNVPASRTVNWTPGSYVGVPGGLGSFTNRNNLIDVSLSPYNADKTGATDASGAINSAIGDAVSNQVVYLPAGTYTLSNSISIHNKNSITLRGEGTNTIIVPYGNCGISFSGNYNSMLNGGVPDKLVSGVSNGSIAVAVTNGGNYSVGNMIQVLPFNDTNLAHEPFEINTGGFLYGRSHLALITNITSNTLKFWPPLPGNLGTGNTNDPSDLMTVAYPDVNEGLENLYINASNCTASDVVLFLVNYGSWTYNVRIDGAPSYTIFYQNCLNCQVEHCWFGKQRHAGSNGAGMLVGANTGLLFENNIIENSYPGIEPDGGCDYSVFAYNFITNTDASTYGIDVHLDHNNFNLYEGNIMGSFQTDGYFGSDSDGTFFRNWFVGRQQDGYSLYAFQAKRFTRDFVLVGNIIASQGWSNSTDGDSTSFGLPNIGNGFSTGTAPPWVDQNTNFVGGITNTSGTTTVGGNAFTSSTIYDTGIPSTWSVNVLLNPAYFNGVYYNIQTYNNSKSVLISQAFTINNPPANFTNTLSGSWQLVAGVSGYQEFDTGVSNTTWFLGNYYFFYTNIPTAQTIGTNIIVNSIYLSGKPAWFGNLAWPPIDSTQPVLCSDITRIPAGYRYVYGVDPPQTDPYILTQPQNQTVTAPTAATFSVTAGGNSTLTYQWSKNSSPIAGATLSSYNTGATSAPDNGAQFQVTVSDTAPGSNAVSSVATLTLTAPPSPTNLVIFLKQ